MANAKENLIVVIPAYEPPDSFYDYAASISTQVKCLVVVNDGSSGAFSALFGRIASLPNVSYIGYEENRGKGYALKRAFEFCLEKFDEGDILVTADCDGQHKIKDIFAVYRATLDHKDSLLLGSRDFDSPNVPLRSRSGNTKIRALFRLFYGIKLYDTQTGLRGMTVATASRFLKIRGNRFEFEMSMLIYAKKHQIRILETPIETVYPDNPEDHVSHFKTFSDTMRILKVTLGNFFLYLLAVLASGVFDIGIFFVLTEWIFPDVSAVYTLIATVTSRVASSMVNFILNYKYVFGGASKKAIIKYYILWLCQMGASYGIVFLFGNVLGLHLTLTKMVGDMLLGILSYQIQQYWVFTERKRENFYSPLGRFLKPIVRFFSREYRCNVLPYDEGVVYVARHLDMHGPMTCLKWLNFSTHPMVLSPFFTAGECYRQFNDYTFSEREGKKRPRFGLKAFFLSRFVPILVRAGKSIPVYRNSAKVAKTFKISLDCLLRGEAVIVFPDVEYTGSAEETSDIYTGFLYLGEKYKRKTGKSLRFVPIYIDDERRTLNECPPVYADNYKADRVRASLALKSAINGIQLPELNCDGEPVNV